MMLSQGTVCSRWVRRAFGGCLVAVCGDVSAGSFGATREIEVHLSPEISGIVTMNGIAVEEARVYRTLDYDEEYFEETSTDENGAFRFAGKKIKSSRPGKLMDETRVRQGNLNCDLITPEKELLFRSLDKPEFSHSAFSICRWNDGLEMDSLEDVE